MVSAKQPSWKQYSAALVEHVAEPLAVHVPVCEVVMPTVPVAVVVFHTEHETSLYVPIAVVPVHTEVLRTRFHSVRFSSASGPSRSIKSLTLVPTIVPSTSKNGPEPTRFGARMAAAAPGALNHAW